MPETSRFVTFDSVLPRGRVSEEMFRLGSRTLGPLGNGQVRVKPAAFSVDPIQRTLFTGAEAMLPQYIPGAPIVGDAVGVVVESRNVAFPTGTTVTGRLEWADTAVWAGQNQELTVVDPDIAELSHALGVYGIVGLTAFYGITEVGQVREGETVLISAAAGAVGSIAGQIAKLRGATVIGLASTQTKRDTLTSKLGFDGALDYRAVDFAEQLQAAMPSGPDVYFDNVGGPVSQVVMRQMRRPGRIVDCGQISTYDDTETAWKVDITPIHLNGLRFEGLSPALFMQDWPRARQQLKTWVEAGQIVPQETRLHGLASLPAALVALFKGENVGKMIVTVGDGE
ncbi:MDR family NADP-dependent oxidoreductase [Mycolicibacterium smegmatis]|uniref:Alcohol dehydrogenase, zinc-binding n=1 Tax=Mycolicibacterium smegmatis (strain MKD8) TaxID=1214915 RepID=A0A2U9Q0Q5_MYCSE|nr:NADP-dependent oxidoreductase [Mycolicibacterium smegmatis]AWT57649.1 alcohol dehydrogenase, zinc-binding [Mycolicibacterium smegmatis MKD8]